MIKQLRNDKTLPFNCLNASYVINVLCLAYVIR